MKKKKNQKSLVIRIGAIALAALLFLSVVVMAAVYFI